MHFYLARVWQISFTKSNIDSVIQIIYQFDTLFDITLINFILYRELFNRTDKNFHL